MLGNRIESIDVFRGITIAAMILVNTPGTWSAVYAPFLHADWHGWTPTDLVFPFFLFIVGCSIAFAYRGKAATGAIYRKITVRSLKLIGLGLFLGAFTLSFPFFKDFADIRFPGVLQRIGVVFFFSALIALHANWKIITGVIIGLLVGYWIWMGMVPLPDGSAPTYERAGNNWAMFVDKLILGTHTWKPDYDPEGLLSTLPSIATCLIGVLTGRLLLSGHRDRVIYLVVAGPVLLLVGLLWSRVFPINKALWTSSFVLVTAGVAIMLLTIIYALTDVKKIEFGTLFKRVGANALILYFLSSFISKLWGLIKLPSGESIHTWLFQTVYVHEFLPLKMSSLLYALSVMAFYLWLGNFLYKRGIFFKV